MRQIKVFLLITFLGLIEQSCLEPYLPEFPKDEVNTLVISGGITDQAGYKNILVTLATNLSQSEFFPVVGCAGYIADDDSNHFNLENVGNGEYRVWMNQADLVPGRSYKLYIKTPLGLEYESDFEKMPVSSEIDTVYYQWETHLTSDPNINPKGLQFYASMHGANQGDRYYQWNVEETWEYHSPYPIEYYYDPAQRKIVKLDLPDYSKMICYSTEELNKIFTMTTQNLSDNNFENFPLNFIDNTSEKLLYAYSVKIGLNSLTERAYNYFNDLKKNIEDQGGLYNQQPLQIQGNIHSLDDPGKRVLGYFYAVAQKSKRITISNIQDLEVNLGDYCRPWLPKSGDMMSYLRAASGNHVIYLVHNDAGNFLSDNSCFDCRLRGGSLTKPAFMP